MSFEFFKFAELAIARNFAAQGILTYVFQFSLDLPGYDGFLRAVHTGDMPIIFRNLTDDVLNKFPGYGGLDRTELRRIAEAFGMRYSNSIRAGEPGPKWPAYNPIGKRSCGSASRWKPSRSCWMADGRRFGTTGSMT